MKLGTMVHLGENVVEKIKDVKNMDLNPFSYAVGISRF